MIRMTRSRLTATGVPTCAVDCRYERGRCPLHSGRVTVANRSWALAPSELEATMDRACACGFVYGHTRTCQYGYTTREAFDQPARTPAPLPAEQLPPGWRDGGCVFVHESGCRVSPYASPVAWGWHRGDGNYQRKTAKPSREQAMCAALGLSACDYATAMRLLNEYGARNEK